MLKIIRNIYTLSFMILICGIFTSCIAFAQPQEYKEYTVKEGDTLWSISSKEMIDPFLWPKVWKENPDIKNPDLIYPGQKIKIPLYLIQKEIAPSPPPPPYVEKAIPSPLPEVKTQPQIKKEEPSVTIRPMEKKYLVDRDTLISSGYITDNIGNKGAIIGSPSGRIVLGVDDYAYINTIKLAKTNDRFYIVRSSGPVKHPETGVIMGYLIEVYGIAEVVGKESGQTKIRITASYGETEVGDLLTDFYEIEPPFLVDNPRTPDLGGFIVASKHRRYINGQTDFAYIDKGVKNGVEVGDIFRITSRGKYNIPNGYIQIINTKESTATAIIRRSDKEVAVGDMIGSMTKEKTVEKPVLTRTSGENLDTDVNLFINQYTRAYESGDIDRFMSFYSISAIENGRLRYDDIRRAYQKNFQDNRYTYTLKNPQIQKSDAHVILTGTYSIKKLQGDTAGAITQGNIKWILTRENGALKIINADYGRM